MTAWLVAGIFAIIITIFGFIITSEEFNSSPNIPSLKDFLKQHLQHYKL